MRLITLLLLCAIITTAQAQDKIKVKNSPAQKFIKKELKNNPLFNNAIVGICAIDENGDYIAEWNSNLPMLTASTLKTVTTGLGLIYLGENYKYSTEIAYSGNIVDSILVGDVHIIGGGDPTLGSNDTIAAPIDSIFNIWSNAIVEAGIKKIDGNIIVDDSFFVRELMPDSWSWGNFGAYYGATASGLSFFENNHYFSLLPGENIGDKAVIVSRYPTIPSLQIINETKTVGKEEGSWSSYYVQDLSLVSKFTGEIAIDKDSVHTYKSNRFPHLSCGYHFKEYLLNNGIEVDSEILDIKDLDVESRGELTYISETYSPKLLEIVNVTNKISNNFYAETILKTIGKEMTGIGSYDSSYVAIYKLLDSLSVDREGIVISDGSGLSRQNYVSPRFFCDFYDILTESNIFVSYMESFPIPGENGTLKSVLKDVNPTQKRKIHAKSGSLSGVRCYAGFVEGGRKSGLIRFAILVNNYSAPLSQMQPQIEKFMFELTKTK